MQSVVANLSIFLIIVILAIFARNLFRRTWDFFSWRNLFLLGFLHFYCLSAYYTATGETLPEFLQLSTGGWSALAGAMVVFFGLFLLCAHIGVHRIRLARLIPKFELPITAPALITSILVLSGLALLFSIPFFNYFGVIAAQIRGQLSAVAVGLAVYYLVARRFNPMAWALFLTALAIGAVSSTVGQSGRRLLLGIMLAIPWMWYFMVWRYRAAVTNAIRVSVFFVLGFVGLVMYSPLRETGVHQLQNEATISKRTDQFVEMLTNPKIDVEAIKYIMYADTVPSTLFVLQNYPDNYAFMPFHGLYWFITNPIPRQVLPGKPEALGVIMQDQMNVPYNVGPGIISHGWSEAWLFGVAYYAIFFGLLVGLVDRACAERAWNPYFLAVFGANLGNVIGLPRGDTPLFMIQIAAGIVFPGIVLYLLKTLSPLWAAFPVLAPRSDTDWVPAETESEEEQSQAA